MYTKRDWINTTPYIFRIKINPFWVYFIFNDVSNLSLSSFVGGGALCAKSAEKGHARQYSKKSLPRSVEQRHTEPREAADAPPDSVEEPPGEQHCSPTRPNAAPEPPSIPPYGEIQWCSNCLRSAVRMLRRCRAVRLRRRRRRRRRWKPLPLLHAEPLWTAALRCRSRAADGPRRRVRRLLRCGGAKFAASVVRPSLPTPLRGGSRTRAGRGWTTGGGRSGVLCAAESRALARRLGRNSNWGSNLRAIQNKRLREIIPFVTELCQFLFSISLSLTKYWDAALNYFWILWNSLHIERRFCNHFQKFIQKIESQNPFINEKLPFDEMYDWRCQKRKPCGSRVPSAISIRLTKFLLYLWSSFCKHSCPLLWLHIRNRDAKIIVVLIAKCTDANHFIFAFPTTLLSLSIFLLLYHIVVYSLPECAEFTFSS
jgi:hypothetical protein